MDVERLAIEDVVAITPDGNRILSLP